MTKAVFDSLGRMISYPVAEGDSARASMGAHLQPRQDAWAAMPKLPKPRMLKVFGLCIVIAAHAGLIWVLVTEKIRIIPLSYPTQVSIMIIKEMLPPVPPPPALHPVLTDPMPVKIAPPVLKIR